MTDLPEALRKADIWKSPVLDKVTHFWFASLTFLNYKQFNRLVKLFMNQKKHPTDLPIV